ncbi:MAG: hypothetical protein HY390_06925 [Deltaproteobacteria bacterium]|nr:hypothetical protein [Deltaproteobacteria bacterium]
MTNLFLMLIFSLVTWHQPTHAGQELTRALTQKSPLLRTALRVNARWQDDQISSGGLATVHARILNDHHLDLADDFDLAVLATNNFEEEYKTYFEQKFPKEPKDINVEIEKKLNRRTLQTVTKAVAEGFNMHEDSEFRDTLEKQLKTLAGFLGKSDSIVTLIAKYTLPAPDKNQYDQEIYAILFLNTETQEVIRIFVKQGF